MVDYPPLAQADDLVDFPGAPFPQSVVTAAGEAVRAAAGWHIAPAVTETLRIDSDGATLLLLPTGRLTAVAEVRDVTGDAPSIITGWRVSHRLGGLHRGTGWPCGFEAVEVDVVHGYTECPPDLLKIVAAEAGRRVAQQSAGPFSVSYADDASSRESLTARLWPYRLGPRP